MSVYKPLLEKCINAMAIHEASFIPSEGNVTGGRYAKSCSDAANEVTEDAIERNLIHYLIFLAWNDTQGLAKDAGVDVDSIWNKYKAPKIRRYIGFHKGGLINGSGLKENEIPAILSQGREFIMPKEVHPLSRKTQEIKKAISEKIRSPRQKKPIAKARVFVNLDNGNNGGTIHDTFPRCQPWRNMRRSHQALAK